MRAGLGTSALAVVLWIGWPGAARAGAQEVQDPDPCADIAGASEQNQCWTKEAERADVEMKETLDALLAKLPPPAAAELKKAQKAWLEFRDAHLALLYAAANPKRIHRTEDLVCSQIARRELSRRRTRDLKRLLTPAADEACPL
jgi:uncharacterized protein YecT (DUF1311 family)